MSRFKNDPFRYCLGIDVKYLANSAVTELGDVDDVGRKVMHLRRMIQRIQSSLTAVDKVNDRVFD